MKALERYLRGERTPEAIYSASVKAQFVRDTQHAAWLIVNNMRNDALLNDDMPGALLREMALDFIQRDLDQANVVVQKLNEMGGAYIAERAEERDKLVSNLIATTDRDQYAEMLKGLVKMGVNRAKLAQAVVYEPSTGAEG